MVLFQVSTHFQLICAIIVKLQMLGNVDADLHLDDGSDFSGIIDNLRKTKLFHSIEFSEQIAESNKIRIALRGTGKQLSPPMPDIWHFKQETSYTDIYFGHDMIPNKMYYYHLVDKRQRPNIHILDEGMTTYFKDIKKAANQDFIDHKRYGKKTYIENITEQLLFNPSLYCLSEIEWDIVQIPYVNRQVKEVILDIYGNPKFELPGEPYLFFAAGGYEEKFFLNEIDLLNSVASVIGKENLVIKEHPRHLLDPYSKFGYQVFGKNLVLPWEVLLLANESFNHIFITIFSNATLSPYNLMGKEQNVVFLYKLFQGTTRHNLFGRNVVESFQYLNKVVDFFNKDKKLIYCPASTDELIETLRYIEGKRKSEKKYGKQ